MALMEISEEEKTLLRVAVMRRLEQLVQEIDTGTGLAIEEEQAEYVMLKLLLVKLAP